MINIYDVADKIICTVNETELKTKINELRKKQTVYIDYENKFIEYPKFEEI